MMYSSKFVRSEKAQIITLAGVIIALTIVLLAVVINTAAISGQRTAMQEVDDAHYVFKNMRDVYGDVLRRVSSDEGNPFNNSRLTSAELNITRMCNAHGFSVLFKDKVYDGSVIPPTATASLFFSDGDTVYMDSVTYELRALVSQTHTYDFSSGARDNKWAYEKQNEEENPPSTGPNIVDEGELKDYQDIATSDDIRYSTGIKKGCYATHHFNFSIEEDPTVITNLYVEWEGYGTQNPSYLYIWNFTSSDWELVGIGTATAPDNVIFKNFQADFGNYIDSSGYLHLVSMSQGDIDGPRKFYTNYVKVEVTYSQ